MSRIGRSPIPVPSGVEVTISGDHVAVKGPRGTLERDLPEPITVRQDDGQLLVERPDDERRSRALRKPEPYKGKGVRYAGERVQRKAGKAGK